MEVIVKVAELPERAVEVVELAMTGEDVEIVNNETRLVVTGGPQTTFPADDEEEIERYERPKILQRD